LALSAASSVVTLVAQRSGNALYTLGELPLSWRLGNAIYSYAAYIVKLFWPVDLALIYPHPRGTLTAIQIGGSALLLVTVSGLVWKLRRNRGYLLTGWLWFLGTLVPVIGIIQVGAQGMADRYAYIPTLGIFLMLVWGVTDLTQSAQMKTHLAGAIAAALAVAALTALLFLTSRQIAYWQDPADLWGHTIEVTKDNFVADDGMADVLLKKGDMQALKYYETAAKLAPWDPVSHAAVAASLHDRSQYQQAIAEYNIALRANPRTRVATHIYFDLGIIYRELGDYARAQENFRRAMGLDPDEVQQNIQRLSERVAARPAAAGYWRLGLMLEGAGQIDTARQAYRKALELTPEFTPALRALEAMDANPQ